MQRPKVMSHSHKENFDTSSKLTHTPRPIAFKFDGFFPLPWHSNVNKLCLKGFWTRSALLPHHRKGNKLVQFTDLCWDRAELKLCQYIVSMDRQTDSLSEAVVYFEKLQQNRKWKFSIPCCHCRCCWNEFLFRQVYRLNLAANPPTVRPAIHTRGGLKLCFVVGMSTSWKKDTA